MSPYWVRPQDFIHITGHILSGQATGEKPLACRIQAWHVSTPTVCHHRQVPRLAGDLPWCKIGVQIPSTAMRRRFPQWGLGKGSTVEGKD